MSRKKAQMDEKIAAKRHKSHKSKTGREGMWALIPCFLFCDFCAFLWLI